MGTEDNASTPERDRTDSSLRAERQKADAEGAELTAKAERRAYDVVDRAREQADETLGAARAKADAKLVRAGASGVARAIVRAEEAKEDSAVDADRRTADFLVESERERCQRAVANLLQAQRGDTDHCLLLERALVDGRLARILVELADAVRFRDAFVAAASHELKTPLTPLALRLESLAREAARQPESAFAHQVRTYVETAQRQVNRLSALIADLLDVSRIDSGKLTFELDLVDFGAIVQEVTARHRPQAERAGCTLEVDAPGVTGRWDGLLLEQVVTSLLENAIKYGDRKPVRVRVEATSRTALLTVQDEGIGIAAEDIRRIFGRFERAVSDQNYGGLGLGLYCARTIVEAMGGTVAVQSEPGRGATFTVDLPLSGPAGGGA
jgi:signal transduction histidine kinase